MVATAALQDTPGRHLVQAQRGMQGPEHPVAGMTTVMMMVMAIICVAVSAPSFLCFGPLLPSASKANRGTRMRIAPRLPDQIQPLPLPIPRPVVAHCPGLVGALDRGCREEAAQHAAQRLRGLGQPALLRHLRRGGLEEHRRSRAGAPRSRRPGAPRARPARRGPARASSRPRRRRARAALRTPGTTCSLLGWCSTLGRHAPIVGAVLGCASGSSWISRAWASPAGAPAAGRGAAAEQPEASRTRRAATASRSGSRRETQ
ncbi:unnamed protein product [Prorocentrum cordatum]|uniref:Uncharacterized protein n=1 Tax=Prorocentrum cordatum TaxID=2364126 RepID=A0ABN9XVP7_9DINO|nr:unnamed protein product [Polarella glacialis]